MKVAVLLLLGWCGSALAVIGFDGIATMSTAHMECMKKNGYEFFIGRVLMSNGGIDTTGVQNIKNARAGGIPYVDAYLFPCHSSACGSAKEQVNKVVQHLRSAGAKVGMLWMDVERYNWPANQATNRQFILDMVAEAKALGEKVGIYAGYYEWEAIVGLSWSGVKEYPLWWPDYNNEASFAGFKPFGGWTKPSIHQFHGTMEGPCSFQIDKSWYP